MPEDRQDRTRRFFGARGLARIARSHVLVIGVGAVGNEVAKNLALLGVGRLTLVDADLSCHDTCPPSAAYQACDAPSPRLLEPCPQSSRGAQRPTCRLPPLSGRTSSSAARSIYPIYSRHDMLWGQQHLLDVSRNGAEAC